MSKPPMWGRRAIVQGMAATAGIGIAGCSGGGDDPSSVPTTEPVTTTPSPPTSPTTAATPDPVGEDVVIAAEDFARAVEVFLDRVDRLEATFDFVDLEPDTMREDVTLGMETLDEVEQASDDPAPAVAALRTVGEWLTLLADALEVYADGLDVLESAAVYVRTGRFSDAVTELRPAAASYRAVVTHVESADERYPEIEVEPIARIDDDDPEAIRDRLEDVSGRANELEVYASTMIHYVEGLVDHMDGRERYDAGVTEADDGRYDDAADAFEEAIGAFEAARTDAAAGEAAAPTPLLEEVVRLTCIATHYRDAAGHYQTAVTEADGGDSTDAQAAYDEALAEEDRANAC